jgi:outer membrane protein assembly factor BamB
MTPLQKTADQLLQIAGGWTELSRDWRPLATRSSANFLGLHGSTSLQSRVVCSPDPQAVRSETITPLHVPAALASRRALLLAFALVSIGGGLSCGDHGPGAGVFPTTLSPVPQGTYPQYRLDPSHVGLSPPGTRLDSDLTLAWKTPPLAIGNYAASKSSPAVDVDLVYVGIDDGQLVALDRRDGTTKWRFQTHRYQVELTTTDSAHLGIHGSPAVDDHHVYIGDYSGYLYAVDKLSGGLVWENQLGGSIGASPVVLGDFVFIAVELPDPDGKVFVVRAQTGDVVWSSPSLGDHAHSSVTIDAARGLLFVGANNGIFYCFDYVNRQQQWVYQTGAAIKSTAALAEDAAYLTSWDTKLHGVAIASGQAQLTFASARASMSSPSVYQETLYFGSGDGLLYAVSAHDGQLDWAFQSQGPIYSSPTVIQDSALIAIGSLDKHLYLLDLDTGDLRQSIELAAGVTSVPVAVGDSLFVNDDAGTVYAFRSGAGD